MRVQNNILYMHNHAWFLTYDEELVGVPLMYLLPEWGDGVPRLLQAHPNRINRMVAKGIPHDVMDAVSRALGEGILKPHDYLYVTANDNTIVYEKYDGEDIDEFIEVKPERIPARTLLNYLGEPYGADAGVCVMVRRGEPTDHLVRIIREHYDEDYDPQYRYDENGWATFYSTDDYIEYEAFMKYILPHLVEEPDKVIKLERDDYALYDTEILVAGDNVIHGEGYSNDLDVLMPEMQVWCRVLWDHLSEAGDRDGYIYYTPDKKFNSYPRYVSSRRQSDYWFHHLIHVPADPDQYKWGLQI
ncbi:MAG: hypothetical protein D6698_17655 [Gammaproteobacteria bacterium]|nr:MAG: hypothetical protein D6698_17655 [Gammaproteobacteria bacterium]